MSGCREHDRGVVLKCTMLSAAVFSIECFGLWVSGLVFTLIVPNEFVVEFWATLVSNNCEGTDAMARDV